MPKMKTNRGAAKRFRRTASGKLRAKQSHKRHILTKKRSKRKRLLRRSELLDKNDLQLAERMLPYN